MQMGLVPEVSNKTGASWNDVDEAVRVRVHVRMHRVVVFAYYRNGDRGIGGMKGSDRTDLGCCW